MSHQHAIAVDLWVPAPIGAVWHFASDAKHLAEISPPFYKMKIESDGLLQNNSVILITLNPMGIPLGLKWHAVISDWTENGPQRKFIDIQSKGPFAAWKHEHFFEEGFNEITGERSSSQLKMHEPGTWIRDRIEYELPYGVLGAVAHALYIRRSIEDMFWYRCKKLREVFPGIPEVAANGKTVS